MRLDNGHDESKTHVMISEYGFERRKLRDSKKAIVTLVGDVHDDKAEDIIEDMQVLALSDCKEINLIISSLGGELDGGLAIIDSIAYVQSLGIKVIGNVHGMAASMAAIILQFCDTRTISKNGWMMNHGVSSFTIGDIKDTKAELVFTQGTMEQFATQYAYKNTSKNKQYHSIKYWKGRFTEKTPMFINATQALEMGLVDKIR